MEEAMKTFDLYALPYKDLEAARIAIECALGIRMEPHESLHRGDYYLFNTANESYELERNFDPFYEEALEDSLSEDAIILYYTSYTDPERAREVERVLMTNIPGIQRVRRDHLP